MRVLTYDEGYANCADALTFIELDWTNQVNLSEQQADQEGRTASILLDLTFLLVSKLIVNQRSDTLFVRPLGGVVHPKRVVLYERLGRTRVHSPYWLRGDATRKCARGAGPS